MLDQWLKPTPVSLFVREYLRRQPYAAPSSALDVLRFFTSDKLEIILSREGADILVVARGKLVPEPVPRSMVELRALTSRGIGLVLRRAHLYDDGLAQLAASLTEIFPGKPTSSCLSRRPGRTDSVGTMMMKKRLSSRQRAQRTTSFATICWSGAAAQEQCPTSAWLSRRPH
jgi:hypothetical protein